MSIRYSRLAILSSMLLFGQLAAAQEGRPTPPPRFQSLEIQKDRSVVVRLWAPKAESVRLTSSDLPLGGPMGAGVELKKNDAGVWEATLEPVAPGTYRYLFNVDGLAVVDPQAVETSQANAMTFGLFSVPGSEVSDLRDVPHGAVAERLYFSKSLGRMRRTHVYTPPGYETGTESYPVFYLLHGASDSDNSWSTVGKAGLILDNLIASGKAKPMVMVMPMGHTGAFSFGPDRGNFQKQMEEFNKDFVEDLKPFVESHYRLSDGRANRAIAGLSMGGAQTLDIAFGQLDQFAYVGVYSSGIFGIEGSGGPGGSNGQSWESAHEKTLDEASLKKGLELVWFATGKDDFLLKTTQATVKMLQSHGFDVVYEETDGGHTWIKWREHYLPAFAQKLFRTEDD